MRRRHLLGMLAAGGALGWARRASAAEMPAELAEPATLSPAAAYRLFNNVTTAGARLVAVGERGRIMLSDDSGKTWRQAPAPISATLVTVRFATPALGWAAGQMGVILKTQDAGETWQLVLNGFQAANLMLEEARQDSSQAELQAAQLLVSLGASNPMLSLVPLSPQHILAFGAFGLALESLDGGTTWRGIAARVQNPQGLHIYGAVLAGNALIAVGEAGFLVHGAPQGTLQAVTSPYQGSLFGVLSQTATNVLAFGLQGTLLQSSNQGVSWQSKNPVSGNAVLCGNTLRDGRIALGDASGNLLLSGDEGASFRAISGTLPVTALAQAPDGALILGSPAGLRRVEA
jgi:photosystem II stability/assembly factor-like uncharacterized protein